MENVLIIIAVLMSLLVVINLFGTYTSVISKKKKDPIIVQDLNVLMDILNNTIRRLFTEKYKLEYELKDMKLIYDFKKDLKSLVQDTLMAFNEPFMKDLQYYYTKDYIFNYVTKTIEIMLMEFIREKKPGIK